MTLPVILTGVYVSVSEVSFFKLAFGYINLALSLLGPISVLLNVEFPKLQIENREKLVKNFKKVSLYGLGLSILLTVGAVIVSPIAFKILYGENFLPSVPYVEGHKQGKGFYFDKYNNLGRRYSSWFVAY